MNTESLVFTDTHCHLQDAEAFRFALSRTLRKKDREVKLPALMADFAPERLAKRARKANVHRLILVGTTPADSLRASQLATELVTVDAYWSYGIHPDELAHTQHDDLAIIQNLDQNTRARLVAIGEVGLDYHLSTKNHAAQIKLLEEMLTLGQELDLPLIFHVREAFADFLAVLDNFSGQKTIRGVVHSFSDSPANLAKALDYGFYIGVNGLATFADVPLPPLERMLIETDAPFLAPRSHRGQMGKPALIPEIAGFIAAKTGVSFAEVSRQTERNAEELFKFSARSA